MRRAGMAKNGHVMRPAVAAVLFACLLLTLAATSTPRVVGDGSEYVHLASRLAAGELPGAGESRHFVFYSGLAAPLIAIGLSATAAFTIVNGLLLAAALYIAASRLHWTWCAIVFAGPILWWLDKPHTEPFTFAMYAIAFALFDSAPWWSLVAAGAASAQNPGNAVLVVILAIAAAAARASILKDRRFWAGLAGGAALAALHPAYYLVRLGTPTRLASTGEVHWVTLREYATVLLDPNVGLLPQVPVYAAAVLLGGVFLAVRAPRRLAGPGVAAALASAAWLALVAATATNVNHGGTPGLSRYATWFIPLAIPLFQAIDRVAGRRVIWMALPAVASAALGVWAFHPARAEAADRPTRLATFLWTRYPSIDNPLPEIFAERLRGLDENWLPVATPDVRKSFCRGGAGATASGRCRARPCHAARAMPGGRRHVLREPHEDRIRVREPPRVHAAGVPPRALGDVAALGRAVVADALASLAWWNMGVRQVGDPDAIVRSRRGTSAMWSSGRPRTGSSRSPSTWEPDAELGVQVPQEMSVALTIESGPLEGADLRLRPGRGRQIIQLPGPQPWVMLVGESR